jgi:HK97 family phage major capsid protein/HK97 family phage prohead protease
MIEYRQIQQNLKYDKESRHVSGYGAVFNSESNDLGFIEIIQPGAIDEDTIKRSDIFATINHDRDKVLARSKNGQGSLLLTIDSVGLKYDFDAPNTTLGDDLLEYLKRGDMDSSSFAFSIDKTDPTAQTWEKRNGIVYRTINHIDRLYDVSCVWSPAYSNATCQLRNKKEDYDYYMSELKSNQELEALKSELDALKEKIKELTPDEPVETKADSEEDSIENEVSDTKEDSSDTSNAEPQDDATPVEDKPVEDEVKQLDEPSDDNENKRNKSIDYKKMEKRFSLVHAINDIANNKQLDSVAHAVSSQGAQEMRSTGLPFGGQIQIPMSELRSNVTVDAEGEDVVAKDLYDIVGPLRAKNVLLQAGAKFLTGLVGDVEIPIMSATNCNWAGEVAAAADGAPTFSNVTLKPKRLTAYVNISKQLLAQDSVDVDNMIRQDIINAVNSKLESTILGTAAGSSTQPAGLFNGATFVKGATTMNKIAEVEGNVEEANVIGDCKWIVSPSFKATLRASAKGSNIAQSLYANGEIDGTEALSTSNCPKTDAVYGDFSNLAIGQWGSIDLTVDPYTQAKNGMVVLVVNAYFDAQVVRPEAFGFATTATA